MKYDVAIMGGGPAGIMAAINAAHKGAKVIILEKNDRLGIKLMLAGNGRCNLMNRAPDDRLFIESFGPNGKFLFSSLNQFGLDKTWSFFESLGIPLKIEENNKVFPQSNKGADVLNALKKELTQNGVEVRYNVTVKKLSLKNKTINYLLLSDKTKIEATNFVLCTGGKSYPQTGSDGSGYALAEQAGHSVTQLFPALTPIILDDQKITMMEGVSLKDVSLKATTLKKVIAQSAGDIIFTNNGISGPGAILLSQKIASKIEDNLILEIDIFPLLSKEQFDQNLINLISTNQNKTLQTVLNSFLPKRFFEYLAHKYWFDFQKKCNVVTAKERRDFVEELKKIKYSIKNLEGFDKAMITVGGVNLKEVDPKTMQSKIIKNLYFAGEILDLAGPTGGYNLQVCWSTGFVAGNSTSK